MDWGKVASVVGEIAPVAGGLLTGPIGTAVTIGGMLASELGTKPEPAAVLQKLKADPQALQRIAQFEHDERQQLRELAFKTRQAELQDTQHAREQHKEHWMPSALTVLLALMVCGIFVTLVFTNVASEKLEIAYMIAGQVLTAFLTCVAFWVGTSKSSQDKGKQLAKGAS